MIKITLSVKDRLMLAPIIPTAGSRLEMINAKSLLQKVEFTAEEIERFELKDIAGGIQGNPQKFIDVDMAITDGELNVLKLAPRYADLNRLVTIDILPLLDKIDYL